MTFDVSVQELADALTMRGLEVSAIVPPPPGVGGTGEDAVLDLEITTNRPDCLSVFGIAREMSTIYDTPLRAPDCGGDSNTGGESAVEVTLEDVGLCPRYAASVANVTVDPSPGWLAARLDAAGIRPINNVVDVTNYVMLELGHPTHAFDLDRLDGRALRIRRAVAGGEDSHSGRAGADPPDGHAGHRGCEPAAGRGRRDGRRRRRGVRRHARRGDRERLLRTHVGAPHQQAPGALDRRLVSVRTGR